MVEQRAVVFVIDDDPSMRLALEDLVRSVGLEVRVFAAPQEFLQSKPPDAPGCLVLDVRLPGMSGLTFHKELAKEGLALPVIFITGHGDIPMSVRAMKAGAVEFLSKPFHDQDLLEAIHAEDARAIAARARANGGPAGRVYRNVVGEPYQSRSVCIPFSPEISVGADAPPTRAIVSYGQRALVSLFNCPSGDRSAQGAADCDR